MTTIRLEMGWVSSIRTVLTVPSNVRTRRVLMLQVLFCCCSVTRSVNKKWAMTSRIPSLSSQGRTWWIKKLRQNNRKSWIMVLESQMRWIRSFRWNWCASQVEPKYGRRAPPPLLLLPVTAASSLPLQCTQTECSQTLLLLQTSSSSSCETWMRTTSETVAHLLPPHLLLQEVLWEQHILSPSTLLFVTRCWRDPFAPVSYAVKYRYRRGEDMPLTWWVIDCILWQRRDCVCLHNQLLSMKWGKPTFSYYTRSPTCFARNLSDRPLFTQLLLL